MITKARYKAKGTALLLLLAIQVLLCTCSSDSISVKVMFHMDATDGPFNHGLTKLLEVLDKKNVKVYTKESDKEADYYIFMELVTEENREASLLDTLNVSKPEGKETLVIRRVQHKNKPAIVICGGDEVGLMYATLDVSKQISWSTERTDLFRSVKNTDEKPFVKERAVSSGTFHRGYFEQKLHDPKYWEKYFDMMAENRLNQFLLILGYKNNQYREPNFTAPAYPNFFNVDEYPFVQMSNVSPEQQIKNTQALKTVIAMAHARGIEFGVGLWDQIDRDGRYRKIVKDNAGPPADLDPNIIWGLSKENLIPYTKLAIRKFFQTFREIDVVQFRMHWESGITGEVALTFWKEMFQILKEECPDIKIEARAKDVPDETLYDGVHTGMDFRVATKHWMEQMGMPFHPTHINKDNQFDRRHGYADLLRYPKKYDFKWRLWSGGTTRLFLWGDPDYVKRFSKGSQLYDACGFEFNEPLYFKMNGSKHNAAVSELLDPSLRYFDYEFERYWHYYQVMGRLAYNPKTSSELWEREFTQRFGKETGKFLMSALHKASKVLPRIVTASYLYPRFASPQGWPELQRMEDLKHFAENSKPSDIQQFLAPKEYAQQILDNEFTVKRTPFDVAAWFSKTAQSILDDVKSAEKLVGEQTKEYISTITDLKMLAHLAKYHSSRLKAAVHYNLYTETGHLVAFDRAIVFEEQAVKSYGNIVEAAGTVYNMQLDFGSNKDLFPGHWRNEHQRLLAELKQLREERKAVQDSLSKKSVFTHVPVQRALPTESVDVSATLFSSRGIASVSLSHAFENKDFMSEMIQVENGIGTAKIVNPNMEGTMRYFFEIVYQDGGKEYLPTKGPREPFGYTVSDDHEAPQVQLDYILSFPVHKNMQVSAKVTDQSKIKKVNLRYRRVTQFEDYQSAVMTYNTVTGRYCAEIPAEFLDGKYDVMYFLEAMDDKGNGTMYPNLEKETPYVIVHLNRDGR